MNAAFQRSTALSLGVQAPPRVFNGIRSHLKPLGHGGLGVVETRVAQQKLLFFPFSFGRWSGRLIRLWQALVWTRTALLVAYHHRVLPTNPK